MSRRLDYLIAYRLQKKPVVVAFSIGVGALVTLPLLLICAIALPSLEAMLIKPICLCVATIFVCAVAVGVYISSSVAEFTSSFLSRRTR